MATILKRTRGTAFNAKQKAHTTLLLRSETGSKLSEKGLRDWETFFVQEKLAYVFEKPFGTDNLNTSFVGNPEAFTLTAVNENLHLASVGLDFILAIGKS